MKVVYARADKVPDNLKRHFKQDKVYNAHDANEQTFWLIGENGTRYQQAWGDNYGIHWTRLEYPYRDPEAVEALIEAAGALMKRYGYENRCKGGAWSVHSDESLAVKQALARLSPDDGEIKA